MSISTEAVFWINTSHSVPLLSFSVGSLLEFLVPKLSTNSPKIVLKFEKTDLKVVLEIDPEIDPKCPYNCNKVSARAW
jgi:hypothetical protein